jgi:hypothetical protein
MPPDPVAKRMRISTSAEKALEQDAGVHRISTAAAVCGSHPRSVRAQAAAWASVAMECVLRCMFE